MTKEQVLNSISLKKRFCKDYNLPIKLYDNPYFMQRLEIIDNPDINLVDWLPLRSFKAVEKFNIFCKELERFKNEQDYFEYYAQVKDAMINFIKDTKDFQNFTQLTFFNYAFPKTNLYKDENCGCAFVSIDMKKANFSALSYFSAKIFDDAATWEEFVGKYTDCKHIIDSKYIRQVVLGACNPKKTISYECYLMGGLANYLNNKLGAEIYSVNSDEIIIKLGARAMGNFSLCDITKAIKDYDTRIADIVRTSLIFINDIPNTKGYIKTTETRQFGEFDMGENHVEFKGLSGDIYHQIVKYARGEQLTDDDLVFYYEGKLARYLEGVDNPWK